MTRVFRMGAFFRRLSDDQAAKIVEATGLKGPEHALSKRVLVDAIDEASERFIHDRYARLATRPKELTNQLKGVATAARRLLRALGVQHDVPTTVSTDLSAALHSCMLYSDRAALIAFLVRLRDGADREANNREQKGLCGESHNRGNEPLRALIVALASAYVNAYNRNPSVSSGNSSGPFWRFVCAALDAVSTNLSDAATDSDPGLHEALKPGKDQVRAVLRSAKSAGHIPKAISEVEPPNE